ncbi:MAG: tetratricopeptide repeat protein [Candidatus Aminicenantes bacterium]|nr:tetratricopeptide repeat protein [Candidatus Aminicenantes bacterium]
MSEKGDRIKIIEAAEKKVKAGKHQEAIAEYRKLLLGSGADVPINNIIGDLYIQLGQVDAAVKIFQSNIAYLEKKGAYSQALAICKKTSKLSPASTEFTVKLGDLYSHLGFAAEARTEYFKAAEELEQKQETESLLGLYEKLTRLERGDIEPRLKLASLYVKTGASDKAVAELNDAAEWLFVTNDFKQAEKILEEARVFKDSDPRTLANLVRIYRKDRRIKDAIKLVEHGHLTNLDNPDLIALLANLYLENKDFQKAGNLFHRFLEEDPENVDVRAKLGFIEIQKGELDKAYDVLEPLIITLIGKNREDRAIGLIGLILMTGQMHIPSLERLASIYKNTIQNKNLEVVDRVLLEEYRQAKLEDKRLQVLQELVDLSPQDLTLQKEYNKSVAKEIQQAEEEKIEERLSLLSEEDRDIIQTNLAKAELYLQQGLVRNARRILENLDLLYPDEPRIQRQLELLQKAKPFVGDEEIPLIIEQVTSQEKEKVAKIEEPPQEPWTTAESMGMPEPIVPETIVQEPEVPVAAAEVAAAVEAAEPVEEVGEKITAAEIFAETDIIPVASPRAKAKAFYNLEDRINEELDVLESVYYRQIKEKAGMIEKELSDIVFDFRRHVEEKIEKTNYEARYSLGIAFMEQGLIDEAIEEFKLASLDPERAMDCFSLISRCLKKKKNLPEAVRWMEQALDLTEEGSDQHFVLTYDLAVLYEDLNENQKAIDLYRYVKAWNATHRNVAKRLKILEKILAD